MNAWVPNEKIAMIQSPNDIDYKQLKGLVIDDYPSMRSAFKSALASFGMTKVDVAASASEAITRVKGQKYDIIICDYNLGEGRDGQQLLEELRHRNLIGLETAFLMVTAESMYENVVAAAELAPDDYLIKPFNGDMLRTRLDVVLAKKRLFRDVYRDFTAGKMEAALEGCDEIMKRNPKYIVDALRFKGEILVAMGDFERAEEHYKQIIALRAVPWSRLGLAKALHMQRKETDAEDLLHDIVSRHPDLVASYDLLADVQLSQNKTMDAQYTLQRGVSVSAKSPKRQRRLGEVALQNEDMALAESAFKATVEKGQNSIFLAPNDFANLSRVYLSQGRPKAASDVILNNRGFLHESREGKLIAAVMMSQISTHNGKTDEAKAYMREAVQLKNMGVSGDLDLDMDMLEACIKAGMEEEANKLLAEVARNAHDVAPLLDKAKKMYVDAGKEDLAATILSQATARVEELSKEGALLMRHGDLKNSVEKMLQASREAPRNPRILMNTAWAILRSLAEDRNAPRQLLHQAQHLLEDAARLAPEHPRLAGLQTTLRRHLAQGTR